MAQYQIELSYAADVENNVLDLETSLCTGPDGSNGDGKGTHVDGDGNITVAKGDSANISFRVVTEGWTVAELELKDSKKSKFGAQPRGKARLTKKEAADFGIDRYSGTRYGQGLPSLTLNDRNQNQHTVNFCVFATNGEHVLVSDPRIRDGGGAE